jgi:hypothetical protein
VGIHPAPHVRGDRRPGLRVGGEQRIGVPADGLEPHLGHLDDCVAVDPVGHLEADPGAPARDVDVVGLEARSEYLEGADCR